MSRTALPRSVLRQLCSTLPLYTWPRHNGASAAESGAASRGGAASAEASAWARHREPQPCTGTNHSPRGDCPCCSSRSDRRSPRRIRLLSTQRNRAAKPVLPLQARSVVGRPRNGSAVYTIRARTSSLSKTRSTCVFCTQVSVNAPILLGKKRYSTVHTPGSNYTSFQRRP